MDEKIRRPLSEWFDLVGEPNRPVTMTEFFDIACRAGHSLKHSSTQAALRRPLIAEYLSEHSTWPTKKIIARTSMVFGVSESTVYSVMRSSS